MAELTHVVTVLCRGCEAVPTVGEFFNAEPALTLRKW